MVERSCGLIIKAIGIDNAVAIYVMLNLSRYTMIKNAIKFEFSGEKRFFIEKKNNSRQTNAMNNMKNAI